MRILRASFLVLVVAMPVVVLACGDDEAAAPSTASTVVPDGSAVAPDAVAEAATEAPIVVTLSIPPYVLINPGYVVFYPKESPDAPVSVPLTSLSKSGQNVVAKAMPQGADVVVVLPIGAVSFVYQIDDIGSGESVYLDLNETPGLSTYETLCEVPRLEDAGVTGYVFSSCAETDHEVLGGAGTQRRIPEPCLDADRNARFVATTSPPLAISVLTIKGVSADDLQQLTVMPAWTTPSPVAWSFTGAPPAGATVDAKVFATSTGQYGGFELARFAAVAQGSSLSFVRAPTSFADTELHVVTGQYPPVAAYSSKVVSIERTAASNPVTTALGALQTHFTGVTVSAASAGSFGLDFTSSATFPSGTSIISYVAGNLRQQDASTATAWLTFSSLSGAGHVEAHALPPEVRAKVYVANVDWVPLGIAAVSGFTPQFMRANSTAVYRAVGADPRGTGLPPGPFSVTVASLTRSAH